MGINLSQGPSTKYYSSDRITQLIGNGLMTFIDKKTMLNKFFNNNEVVFYKTIKDLSKKIIKYNDNDKLRIKIAKNGKNKYLKYFNSKNVANFIIQKTKTELGVPRDGTNTASPLSSQHNITHQIMNVDSFKIQLNAFHNKGESES